MSEDILDAEKKTKYPSIWKTGIASGLLTLVLVAATSYIISGHRESLIRWSNTLLSLVVVAGISIGMVRLAALGKRNKHFWIIFATGLIGFQVFIISMLFSLFILSKIEPIRITEWQNIVKHTLVGNILVFFFAFLFWLVPGKLPYFRKQVEG